MSSSCSRAEASVTGVVERCAVSANVHRVASLDLSTWWGSAALVERDVGGGAPEVVATLEDLVAESHAPHVLGMLDRVLRESGWSRSSLDGFVATRGPGSFTGVRIGLGTIRGLAIASGRPAAAVPTLDAMAQAHGPAERDRIAILSAGRGQIFAARYDARSSPPLPIGEPWLGDPSDLVDRTDAPAILIPMRGQEELARTIAIAQGHECGLAVRAVAASAGWLALVQRAFDRPADLAPIYLRPPVVENARDGA